MLTMEVWSEEDLRELKILNMRDHLYFHKEKHPDFNFEIYPKKDDKETIMVKTITLNEEAN